MIGASVVVYLLATILVGYFSSRLVYNATDFLLAGRRLSFPLATSALFATWFGSETMLGGGSQFAREGVPGIMEEPLGAALCLILTGLFFARPLYRLNLLTFGDFYRLKFGVVAEKVAVMFMIPSYFGWIAAQFIALGLVIQTVTGIPEWQARVAGMTVVVAYTIMGGMWAVSVTDTIQSVIIIAGLVLLTMITNVALPVGEMLTNMPADFYRWYPEGNLSGWMEYIAAWIIIGLGSIPQQDVFQRVMGSRSEGIAVGASVTAGVAYLTIALLPLVLSLAAVRILPELPSDDQLLLPALVKHLAPEWLQVLFYGALTSAVMSTASGAILAPAGLFAENLIRPALRLRTSRSVLLTSRLSVAGFALTSLAFCFFETSIFRLVSDSSALSLVTLFVPLVFGLFLPGLPPRLAVTLMITGFLTWIMARLLPVSVSGEPVPPVIFSLMCTLVPAVLFYIPVVTAAKRPDDR